MATLQGVGTVTRRLYAYDLSTRDARSILDLAQECHHRYGHVDNQEFLQTVGVIAQRLPEQLRIAANRAKLDDTKLGFVVNGNEIDESSLGATPASWREADTEASRALAFMIMLYGALFGEAIAWRAQQDGRLVTDVIPTLGMETSQVSASSESALGWHVEDAFSPYRADHVALLCLRTPSLVATTLSWVDMDELSHRTREALFERRFRTAADPSHQSEKEGEEPHEPVAILSGCRDFPVLRIDRDYTIAVPGDVGASEALEEITNVLDANLSDLPLSAGCLGVLDNRNVVHGRRPFRARFDGTDRWLKRVNIAEDFRRTRPGRATSTTRAIG